MKNHLLILLAAALMAVSASAAFAAEPSKAILVVSFGTTYNETRAETIDAIEDDIASAFPGWKVQRAFTAQTVIDRIAARDGVHFPNVEQALSLLWADGVRDIVVQPTHIMNGIEYDDLIDALRRDARLFSTIRVGAPLLTSVEDYEATVKAIFETIGNDGESAYVFMGHGSEHAANASYSELELLMHRAGHANAFVGTVEGYPEMDDVLGKVKASGAKHVILSPLMVVAGDHAHNDMAGDEDDSWKSAFAASGIEVTTRVVGLGSLKAIRDIYVDHVKDAIASAPIEPYRSAAALRGRTDPNRRAILVASFGTSFNDSREKTIDAIERDIRSAYPEWEVRRAFTAQTIIDRVHARDGVRHDNVGEAMRRLAAEGYGTVIVQPTHVMPGYEYDDVYEEVISYGKYFGRLVVSEPLLSSAEDARALVAALEDGIPEIKSKSAAVVLMGHGTEHWANAVYSQLQLMLRAAGRDHVFVGTVENYPLVEDVIEGLKAAGAKRAVMLPLMIVAGDHANNDMAGDEEDSWKTLVKAAGIEAVPRIKGLGENAAVRAMLLEHLADAMKK